MNCRTFPKILIAITLISVINCSYTGQPTKNIPLYSELIETEDFTIRINNAKFHNDINSYLDEVSITNFIKGADFTKKMYNNFFIDKNNFQEILIPTKESFISFVRISSDDKLAQAPYNIKNGDRIKAIRTKKGYVFGLGTYSGSDLSNVRFMFIFRTQDRNKYGIIYEMFDSNGEFKVNFTSLNLK